MLLPLQAGFNEFQSIVVQTAVGCTFLARDHVKTRVGHITKPLEWTGHHSDLCYATQGSLLATQGQRYVDHPAKALEREDDT
jgi:hypothetical protein